MKRCRWAIVGTGEVAGKFTIGLRSVPEFGATHISWKRGLNRSTRYHSPTNPAHSNSI